MKQAFILLLLISITATCFGQKSMPAPSIQSDYLEKSKHQNTTAWILLAGGAALFTIGAIIPQGEEEWSPIPIYGGDHKNDAIKGTFYLFGSISMLGSVPVFIAAGKNKRRAMTVSTGFKLEKASVAQVPAFVKKSYPALSLKIGL